MTPEQDNMGIALDKAQFVRVFDDIELIYVWSGGVGVNIYTFQWKCVDYFSNHTWELTRAEIDRSIEEHHDEQTKQQD